MLFILQSTKDPIIVVGPVHNTFGKEVLLNLETIHFSHNARRC